MSQKAKLVSALKKKGIPIPENATIKDLEHRLEHWKSPIGWLLRLAKPSSRKPHHPVSLITTKETCWIPDSLMAKLIVESKLVFVLGRTSTPPESVKVIDIPKDFNDRWPVLALGEEE